MKRIARYFLIFLSLIVVIITLAYLFISPIALYLLNKHCIEWTGRKITVGSLKVNAFNGSVYVKDIKVYEANGDSIFFDCHDIYLKVNLKKMLAKFYEVDTIKIDEPEIHISQDGNNFNFDDLVKHFSSGPEKQPDTARKPETQFHISNITINNANITYNNIPIHNIFRIHNLNFNLPEISWDKPESKVHLDFIYGTGGLFNIDLDANRKTFAYNLALLIDKYDLSQYYAPLNSIIKISSLKGLLTTKIRVHGTFNKPQNISLHGYLNLDEVELKDLEKRKFFAFRRLSLDVDSVDVKHNHYDVNHIILDKPYIAYDVYQNGNNLSQMVRYHEQSAKPVKDTATGKANLDYSNIFTLLQSSVKAMTIDFLRTNYHADSIAIRNGEISFNDYTPNHNFHYNVSKINFLTSEVSDANDGVLFHATAKLGDSGKFTMRANISYNHRKKALSYRVDTLKFSDISPIAKYVLERNSVKWTGRRITTGSIKVNAVKGSIFIKDIKIYEPDSTSVFFACHDVYLRVNLMKIFDNEYQIEKLKIDNPEISIVQNGNSFNFEDLVKRFAPTSSNPADTNAPGLHYNVDSIMINHGNITYNNVPIHNIFRISDLNFRVPEISWNNPVSKAHLDFNYGTGGFFNVDMDVNRNTYRYNLALQIDNYDLSQYYAPLNSFIKISSLKGTLNTKLRLHGRLNNPKHISLVGYLNLNNVEINDSAKRKFFAMDRLAIDVDSINVKHNLYAFRNIELDKPYIVFDYYPNGNNISQMIRYNQPAQPVKDTSTGEIKPDYSNIFTLLASSVKLMAVDFVNTNYHTDSILIRNGQFIYNDYTLNTPFHYNVSNLNINTDKISAAKRSVQFNLSANLNDTGKFAMNADISLDLKNMLFTYNVSSLRLSDLNPYINYYVATPFDDGYLNYESTDSVINRNLKSSNILHIKGIQVGKKTENKPVYHLPVRLAVSLLKDEKGNIDINIPASGNLDDPNYKIGKLVGHVLTELVVKTAESPFKFLAKLFDKKEPEDLKQLQFEYRQDKLEEKQIRKLEDVYKVLEKKKELNVEITQVIDSLAEKDELALFKAKEQYFYETKRVVNDSLLTRRKKKKELHELDKLATQDSLFDKYLNEKLHLTGAELMTVEDKCIQLVGDTMLNKEIHKMIENRNKQITDYLINKKSVHPKRVKVATNKDSTKNKNSSQPAFDINYNTEEK
jgi:uncharacterized protein involved in outer membrane biogenesis